MFRLLAHLLVLLTVVSTTLAGIPCACAASGSHSVEETEPVSSCCAGAVEQPEDAGDDCPHCLTGTCDMSAVSNGETISMLAASWVHYDLAFATSHQVGFEPAAEDVAVPMNDGPVASPIPGDSGRDRCVQNQVIRC